MDLMILKLNNMTKKLFIFLLLTPLLFTTPSISMPNIQAKTLILMDYNSGKILFERDADHQIYPASMTKIMTSIIAFDLLKKNKISKSWVIRQRRDKYVRQSKLEGYRSRAVYKLKELDEKFK